MFEADRYALGDSLAYQVLVIQLTSQRSMKMISGQLPLLLTSVARLSLAWKDRTTLSLLKNVTRLI